MPLLLEPDKHTAVELDNLPRVARYRDEDGGESQHVLYWDVSVVRTLTTAEWQAQRGPLPADPTLEQIAAAIAARAQARQLAEQDAQTLRQLVRTRAQAAVGVRIDLVDTPQLKALLACLLWKVGALDTSGAVRPLAEWLDR